MLQLRWRPPTVSTHSLINSKRHVVQCALYCMLHKTTKVFHFKIQSWIKILLFSSGEGVWSYPGVGDGDTWSDAEAGQVGRQGALQYVGVSAHSVFRLAHIQALGEEARVVRCLRESRERTSCCKYMLFDQLGLPKGYITNKKTSNENQINSWINFGLST